MPSPLAIPEVLLVVPTRHGDSRGFFMETWQQERYAAAGIVCTFVQDNLSRSRRGTLRGLHFQEPNAQGKLVMALAGSVFDVVVDIRRGSPTFGEWLGAHLSADNGHQLWVPPGFAHGFCITADSADFMYKCTAPWSPTDERIVRYDDPDIGIDWPIAEPMLSDRDRAAPLLRDAPVLPAYAASA